MQARTRIPAGRRLSVLLPAVLLAVAAAITLLTNSETSAQTESSSASGLAVPALTARATGSGVELSWESVPNAVRYELLTWWASDPGWQAIGGSNLTGTSYTHADVTAGRTYLYSIRALNAAGEAGPWLTGDYPTATALAATGSATATPTVASAPASGPTSTSTSTPTATATASASGLSIPALTARATAGGVELSWAVVAGAVRYELLTHWDAGVGWRSIGGSNLTGTSYTHAEVRAGTTYYYSIRALNAAGEASAWLLDYATAVALALTGSGTSTPTATATPTATPGAAPTAATTERGALIALYEAAGGAGWTDNDNWLSDAPLSEWDRIRTDGSGRVVGLHLGGNNMTGSIPDLSALTELEVLAFVGNRLSGPVPDLSALGNLEWLYLNDNELTGEIPDVSALTELRELDLGDNRLSGEIPDLSLLAKLRELNLGENRLSGSIPDLGALAELTHLDLGDNGLSGSIPELSAFTSLTFLNLSENGLSGSIPELSALARLGSLVLNDNRLSGPLQDLSVLPNLARMYLGNNELSGPLPDIGALANLERLDLGGNRFCLAAGASLSHAHSEVDAHLKSLTLPACTGAELALVPAAPRNLTATVGAGRVTLAWDASADAAGYDLWVWDSLERKWGPVGGGFLTGTSYSHPVLSDGRNYYFQVRARDAAGVRSAWSARARAIVVTPRFPPPPASLGLDIFYQKYLEVNGVVVTAPTEVSDGKMEQVREVVAAMFSGRPAFFENVVANHIRIVIFKFTEAGEGVDQLPELSPSSSDRRGSAFRTSTGAVAAAAETDANCYVLIHEFAHAIHFALYDQPDGQEFHDRLEALYNAALAAGLWQNAYASENVLEYWAETVTFWFHGTIRSSPDPSITRLEDYDPAIARLIEETFGAGAYVPDYCKP